MTNDLARQTAALKLVEEGLPQRKPARKRARNTSGEVESQNISWADQVMALETARNPVGTADGLVIPVAEPCGSRPEAYF